MTLNVTVSGPSSVRPSRARRGRRPPLALVQKAARLCCEQRLRDEDVAAQLGICRRTLARWKGRPEFEAEYARHLEAFEAAWRAAAAQARAEYEAELARAIDAKQKRRG